jgi:Rad3-related DNA helicase
VCSKCGRSHSKEEYEENRFCRQCGQILVHQNVKTINTEKNSVTEHGSMGSEEDFMQLFPYVPYPQQLTFMQDATKILSQGGVFVAEACNGFGKTVCVLSSCLPLGRKVIYATRTHEQVKQVLREVEQINKKSDTKFSAVALASRQNLCLNEVCRKLPSNDAVEACRLLRDSKKCLYKSRFNSLPSSLPMVLSIKKLLKIGKTKNFCPYFLSRRAAEDCLVVVAPYQYIFNERIRATVKLDISDKVLIFDEAHNADKISQEVLSDTLSEKGLKNAKKELEQIGLPNKFIDQLIAYLEETTLIEHTPIRGSQFHLDLKQLLGDELSFYVETFSPTVNEVREHKLSQGEAPVCYLSGLLRFLSLVESSDQDSYAAIFRKSPYVGNMAEYRCLDPTLALKPVLEEAYASLIMSGTLSPLDLFTETLGLSDAKTHTYSAIAKPENIRTYVDVSVTTRFEERSAGMLELYGDRISKIMKKVPNGALIFFPQRRLMNEAAQLWRKTGFIKRHGNNLFMGSKKVFVEGTRASQNSHIVDNYKKTARTEKGAVLFAVFRGRNAEGSNFPYEEARGIFNVGVPYADYHDPLVKVQIEYFNKKKPRLGELWYLMDAFRAANQAMGRGIRHRDDWCHFYLMDRRYATHSRFISKWAVVNGINEVSIK